MHSRSGCNLASNLARPLPHASEPGARPVYHMHSGQRSGHAPEGLRARDLAYGVFLCASQSAARTPIPDRVAGTLVKHVSHCLGSQEGRWCPRVQAAPSLPCTHMEAAKAAPSAARSAGRGAARRRRGAGVAVPWAAVR